MLKMVSVFKKQEYSFLYILLLIVYVIGLFIPLMENDSAQHATMAMRMYLENDFLNIYRGENPYLDKPHLHFWLSALAFKIFGVYHWAYRIPALVFTFSGAYACYKLANELYRKESGHFAALIFLSAQAIFLANHDVRTDAVLTGAVILSLWQLVCYINHEKLKHLIFGAFFAALAFSTKGLLGVFILGVCTLSYVLYKRKLVLVFNWKSIIGLLVFVLSISPVLYAYYYQFDLHPEKVFNGQKNVSGVKFILWDQSFNRLTSHGFKPTSPDYLFFFHTILWAFLPWSLLFYAALFTRIKQHINAKFKYVNMQETLTSVGVLTALIVMSFSKFKLPHYLNSIFPVAAVLVAGYILFLKENNKTKALSIFLKTQYLTLGLGSVFVVFLSIWAFNISNKVFIIGLLAFVIITIYFFKKNYATHKKLIIVSVLFMVLINYCLNYQFYPNLLNYQAGNNASKIITLENINSNNVYILKGKQSWSLEFYAQKNLQRISANKLNTLEKGTWLFAYKQQLDTLKTQVNFSKKHEFKHYRVTKLKFDFLNPKTRHKTLKKAYLLQIN
ncbi:glycosyltransferase family 39 protein [Seonamhaeicola algicola]|uniref:Glycosyltransferase family 39 protein n=2 Tax=Seonamhaeicola algicola TaxID=1719036 RepID=A0A5C7AXG4_9FLAO|nr:glycosyltransferase family 39 protein [Seonamhaeicola algicola]